MSSDEQIEINEIFVVSDYNLSSETLSEDSEGPSGAKKTDFDPVFIAPVDFTVGTLASMIGKQIDLDPEFQRRGVWSRAAKSQLIESFMLSIPVPQILLAASKSDKSRYLVLDGKQRLLAIDEFVNRNGFKLSGLKVLTHLNNKNWRQLEEIYGAHDNIKNEPIRTTVLRGWQDEAVLYEIFNRLNSGSVTLSPMELRMALHPGKFLRFVIKYTEQVGPIQVAMGFDRPDPRMKDVELIIRFLAINDGRWQYTGNLKEFLDEACVSYNQEFEDSETGIIRRISELESASMLGREIFGNKFGRKYSKQSNGEYGYDSRFNRVVFEIVASSLSNFEFARFAEANPEVVKSLFERLSTEDSEFVQALSSSTKNTIQTRKRFAAWYRACTDASGIDLPLPNIA